MLQGCYGLVEVRLISWVWMGSVVHTNCLEWSPQCVAHRLRVSIRIVEPTPFDLDHHPAAADVGELGHRHLRDSRPTLLRLAAFAFEYRKNFPGALRSSTRILKNSFLPISAICYLKVK